MLRRFAIGSSLCVLVGCGGDAPKPGAGDTSAKSPDAPMTQADLQRIAAEKGLTLPGAEAAGERPLMLPGAAAQASDEEDRKALKIEVLREGEGPGIERGQTGKFHYTGMLLNGKVFDSSRFDPDPESPDDGRTFGKPTEFALQEGSLIRGWTLGIPGMKVGERRRITIPARLGYGEYGRGDKIPGNSTLVFDIELVDVVR